MSKTSEDHGVIDLSAIQNLKELNIDGQPDLLMELVALFKGSTPSKLEVLRSELNFKNLKSIANEAHSLKSSAANLGAKALSQACLELEQAATSGNEAVIANLITKVQTEYERSIAALDEIVKTTA